MPSDVVVIGLGAIGAATLYQFARRGVRVIGIDRYAPPHDLGSSHGETRITRLSVGEGEIYLPLVRRSHAIWRELERQSGVRLMQTTGGLIIGSSGTDAVHHGKTAFVARTIALAERDGIAHELLSPDALMARFPQFRLRGDEIGYFEPEAGMLFPEACVRVQLDAARVLGAEIRTDETALGITEDDGGVRVRTSRATLRAARCVVAAGPWIGKLLGGPVSEIARVYRQVLHWFAPSEPDAFAAGRMPVFIWMHGSGPADYLYGFPASEADGGVKVATENYGHDTDPESVSRSVERVESDAMFETHLRGRFPGLSSRVLRAKACLYTVTPDSGFVVDNAPGMTRVLAVSACSGHAFKHSAALGEAIAQRVVDGNSEIALDAFRLDRLRTVVA
ncbi:MAG TPA: N-methyl-L-tryptophan oxidase [Acetobacteraceae bacterium]|jgi:sarcosine oxidase|nr:N-methyl-L-tryptophan oxidase [Acetobacteraceae bacterium]